MAFKDLVMLLSKYQTRDQRVRCDAEATMNAGSYFFCCLHDFTVLVIQTVVCPVHGVTVKVPEKAGDILHLNYFHQKSINPWKDQFISVESPQSADLPAGLW